MRLGLADSGFRVPGLPGFFKPGNPGLDVPKLVLSGFFSRASVYEAYRVVVAQQYCIGAKR